MVLGKNIFSGRRGSNSNYGGRTQELTGQLKGKKVNARQAMAWAEDRIEYDDITLGEMVKKLSRQYDVHIQLESEKLGDMKFRVSLRN